MGSQLYLPAGWARHLESRVDPSERLAELEKDRAQARVEIREILERLAETHGATARDVTVAMRSIDDRRRVVDMWRSEGLVCAQVAEGDF